MFTFVSTFVIRAKSMRCRNDKCMVDMADMHKVSLVIGNLISERVFWKVQTKIQSLIPAVFDLFKWKNSTLGGVSACLLDDTPVITTWDLS